MKTVTVNDQGLRVGQRHQRARLTDSQVEVMRQLHEVKGWGHKRVAKLFNASRSHVRAILLYRVRAQTIAGHKAV